ncbi:MAG: SCO family protein [Gallionella sp.]
MYPPSLRLFTIVAQVVIALLCALTIPTAQAHSGHHAHEHKVVKASGGDFTLTAASGPVALKDFRGKVAILYFGYTHCKDICPVDLGKLGSALQSMKKREVAGVQPLFITLDPARDDAKQMAVYCLSFHPRLIGLTGTEEEVAAVAKAYGVSYEKGPVDAAGGYDIAHPSDMFIVARNGKLLHNLPQNTSQRGIVAALRKALRATDR